MTASTPNTTPEVAVRRLTTGLVALGILSLTLYTTVFRLMADAPLFMPGFYMYPPMWALYFTAVYLVWRYRATPLPRRQVVALTVGAGALFRLALVTSPVPVNSDIVRYLWEGKVLLAGINTYIAPPVSPVYDGLRARLYAEGDNNWDWLFPKANVIYGADPTTGIKRWMSLADIRDTYGVAASALFAIPTVLGLDGQPATRLIMTAFDVGSCVLLLLLLVRLKRNPLWALVYCWSPLVIDSFADQGHVDAPMLFFIILTMLLLTTGRRPAAGLAFALALGMKVSPLLLFMPFVRLGGKRFVLVFAVAMSILYWPMFVAGPHGADGLAAMANYWRDNDSIYSLLWALLNGGLGIADPDRLARKILMVAWVGYALWRGLRRQADTPQGMIESVAYITTAGMLLTPAAYPWYGTTLVACLCFVPSPALLLLTMSLMQCFLLSVLAQLPRLPAWIWDLCLRYPEPYRWIGYLPVYALLVVEWIRWLKAGRPTREL